MPNINKIKKTTFKILIKINNKENLGTELKNNVIMLGVPSYTSGAQIWNGAIG